MMLVVASPIASASCRTPRFRLRRPVTNTSLALLVLACKWAVAVAVLTGALRMAMPKPYLGVLQTVEESSDGHAFARNAPEALDHHGKRQVEVMREMEMAMASNRERAWTAGASNEGKRAVSSMNRKNHSEEKQELRWTERHERLWAQLWTLPVVLTRGRLGKEGAISCGGANGPAGAVVFREWRHIEAQVPGLAEHLPETQPTVGLGWRLNASRTAVRPTCAVVGNSGRLLQERHRAAVDAKDVVIRFNQGRVRGFESHVGSKSSVRLFNGPYADPLSPEEATIATLRDAAMREWLKSRKHRKQRFRKQLEGSYLLDPEFICHAWQWVDRQGQKPSTGLVGVLMAARMCASVDVYGFQWRGYFNASVQPHYYDWERPKPGRENAHPFQLEADTLSVLQAAGKVVLH